MQLPEDPVWSALPVEEIGRIGLRFDGDGDDAELDEEPALLGLGWHGRDG